MLKVASRTLDLLELFCLSAKKEFTVKELSEELQVDKATVHRLLKVLTVRGYLEQEKKGGVYRLGLKIIEVAAGVAVKYELLDAAMPLMGKLSVEFEETVNLGVMRGPAVVYIHKIESTHFLRTDLKVGTAVPAHCSGLGKAMLAWLEPDEITQLFVNRALKTYTAKTIGSMEQLLTELAKVRELGYAVDNEEYIDGIICIAAPIFNTSGKPCASISISGPTVRMKHKSPQKTGEIVRAAALKISTRLGYKA